MNNSLSDKIRSEMQECIYGLTTEGLANRQNMPVISHLNRTNKGPAGWEVKAGDFSSPFGAESYEELYIEALSSNNYALEMIDGALIQFYYTGRENSLLSHRLAYLPEPALYPYLDLEASYNRDVPFLEVVGKQAFPVVMRFDYDANSGVATDISHPVSHLTLGQYQHCRIPVNRAISPAGFLDFVINNLYIRGIDGRIQFPRMVLSWRETITSHEQQIAHIVSPL